MLRNSQEFFDTWDDYCFYKDPKNGSALMTEQELAERQHHEEAAEFEHEIELHLTRMLENQTDPGFERWENERVFC
jgi:hypothetical protein